MAKECNIQKNSIGKGIEKQIQPSRIAPVSTAQLLLKLQYRHIFLVKIQ